jgi:hypothetical protein
VRLVHRCLDQVCYRVELDRTLAGNVQRIADGAAAASAAADQRQANRIVLAGKERAGLPAIEPPFWRNWRRLMLDVLAGLLMFASWVDIVINCVPEHWDYIIHGPAYDINLWLCGFCWTKPCKIW